MATSTHSQTLGVITFSSGYFVEILDIQHSGVKRDNIDCTNMSVAAASAGTYGNKVYIPSFYVDSGEFTVKFNYNPDTLPPIGSAAETVTVKIGNSSTQAQLAASGWMYDFSFSGPLDGQVMQATAKLKLTGAVTKTAGT